MESAAIFLLAKMRGVEAGTILAVSNAVGDPELVPETVLKGAVDRMIQVALEAALRWKEGNDGV
jgi:Uridine phosphorylase